MEKVTLGKSNLKISRIGLGTMGMSEFYGPASEEESVRTIHRAIEEGINFFDTADMYGPFHNEVLLGRAIKGRRDGLVIATKFGIVRSETDRNFRGVNGRPDYVKKACEESLRRLNIDVIDLYYMHRKDPHTPIEDTVGAMAELVEEGKVKCLGLSEVSGNTLQVAYQVHPIAAVQSEYSLWSTDIEDSVLPVCEKVKATLVAYSPLGRGFLTGQIKKFEDLDKSDYRRMSPRFQGENFQKNLDLVDEVKAIAGELGATPSQVALAWLLAKGDHIVPIPGTKREKYLLENINALKVKLSQAIILRLDKLSSLVAGDRYPESGMKMVNA